ncbi:MAG TPA: HAD-IIIA family hydrolase [Actinophytocola sp.]|uniref:HAD-IIIA family hydrolase n=1 Tax=Actinophytocola sp. TaxID=1872138 RepID=UPI002DBDB517|nr:HAD-IIIA family hydrolase [Actinophytocola sp.]HEU5469744.1 HAD-IIIA family hydrolase [Actinophytocola sp.]
MSRAGVLLDRDGTIIIDRGYVGSVDRVEFIPGAIAAIAALNEAGIPVAVVTNQAGVARGYYGIEDVHLVHKHIDEELARRGARIDLWLFCPYHADGVVQAFARASADRKPGPGMGLAAAQALDLDLSASWVVGDSATDIGLAKSVGARPLYVGPPNSADPTVASFPDLAAAVEHILASRNDPVEESGVDRPVGRSRFPAYRFDRADEYGGAYVSELSRAFGTVDLAQVARAADILVDAYQRDAAVFACGNGGSASIANHLQCDHVKGVRNGTDLTTRVFSLSTNVELLSAIANDLGYDQVFEYQLQSMARPGDVLIAVSSSGRSPNIVRALDWAGANGMRTIALTGFEGGPARAMATATVHVDSTNYGIVEDTHQACMHLLAQYVRQSRMTADAVASQTF